MRKIIHYIKLHLVLIIVAGIILPGCTRTKGTAEKKNDHKPITKELINLVEKNPEIGNMLTTSIADAKQINPDKKNKSCSELAGLL